MPEQDIVCFQCGQSVGGPPRLNCLEGGEPCHACADRLLDTLPSIFHTPFEGAVEESVEPEPVQPWEAAGWATGGDGSGL